MPHFVAIDASGAEGLDDIRHSTRQLARRCRCRRLLSPRNAGQQLHQRRLTGAIFSDYQVNRSPSDFQTHFPRRESLQHCVSKWVTYTSGTCFEPPRRAKTLSALSLGLSGQSSITFENGMPSRKNRKARRNRIALRRHDRARICYAFATSQFLILFFHRMPVRPPAFRSDGDERDQDDG
jgi:hypothetical protein